MEWLKRSYQLLLIIIPFAWSCSDGDIASKIKSKSKTGSTDATRQEELPKEYFDAVMAQNLHHIDQENLEYKKSVQYLLIDMEDAKIEKGFGIGKSHLICDDNIEIPGLSYNKKSKDKVFIEIKEYFKSSNSNVEVIKEKVIGDNTNLTIIHVGGKYSSFNCKDKGYLPSIAPLDKSNINGADMGFVFEDFKQDENRLTQKIIKVAANTFGIDSKEIDEKFVEKLNETLGEKNEDQSANKAEEEKVENKEDNTLPTENPGYGEEEEETDDEKINDEEQENPYESIPDDLKSTAGLKFISGLGKALSNYDHSNLMETNRVKEEVRNIMPVEGINLAELDFLLSVITEANFKAQSRKNNQTNQQNNNTTPNQPSIPTGSANGSFEDILKDIIIGGGGNTSAPNTGTSTPKQPTEPMPTEVEEVIDFSKLIEIDKIDDYEDLFETLRSQSYIIDQNYSGQNRDALMTMLKIGYSQVYKNNFN